MSQRVRFGLEIMDNGWIRAAYIMAFGYRESMLAWYLFLYFNYLLFDWFCLYEMALSR